MEDVAVHARSESGGAQIEDGELDEVARVEIGDYEFGIGDVVKTKNNHVVIVRFIGKTHFSDNQTLIGIEKGSESGTHNGTVDGIEYFECPESKGAFLPPDEIQKKLYPDELLKKLAQVEREHQAKVDKILKGMKKLEEENAQILAKNGPPPKPDYTVYYWSACKKFCGRAIGIILTLDAAGANYEIKDKEEANFDEGFAVPMIELKSGQFISQTPAILDILGSSFNLQGATKEEIRLCKQSVLDVNDIFGESKGFKEKPDRMKKWFTLLEKRLSKQKFLAGETPTVADYHGVFAFEWVHARVGDSYGEEFPNVARWWSELCETPAVKKMKDSGIKMIPA